MTYLAWVLGMSLLAAFCGYAEPVYEPYRFSTLVGRGNTSDADGAGTNAGFNFPQGVAVDAQGVIYVADGNNYSIRKMTSTGNVTHLAGSRVEGSADGQGTNAHFHVPSGIAVDRRGNVYVGSSAALRQITPAGLVTTLAGNETVSGSKDGIGTEARFSEIHAIAVAADGDIYLTDSGNFTLRKVTPEGVVTTIAGRTGFRGTTDGDGAAARFFSPSGMVFDAAGSLFVADTFNNTIRKLTRSGTNWTVATFAGLGGFQNAGLVDATGTAARFNQPQGLAIDDAGNLFVADTGNNSIRKITPAGQVTTVAGKVNKTGKADGTGSEATFNVPVGVAVDRAGNLFVTDSHNHTIRRGFPAQGMPSLGTFDASAGFRDGQFGFNVAGPAGTMVTVEVSEDLVNWMPVSTNTIGAGALPFSDSQGGGSAPRFYRARTP